MKTKKCCVARMVLSFVVVMYAVICNAYDHYNNAYASLTDENAKFYIDYEGDRCVRWSEGDIYYYTIVYWPFVVVSSIGDCSSLTIPSSVYDEPVRLGIGAMAQSKNLSSVLLPDTITSIPAFTFADCTNLSEVRMNNVDSVGMGAFMHCSSLTDIDIPNSLISIGPAAFYASGVRHITIPDNVQSVGEAAFGSCANLESITFTRRTWPLDYLTKTIHIADDDAVWRAMFYECDRLFSPMELSTLWTIVESITPAEPNIKNVIFGDSVSQIDPGCCSNHTSITRITLEANVTNIGARAFYNCTKLETVEIKGDNVCVDEEAFAGCTALKNIDFGKLARVKDRAFAGCQKLKKLDIGSAIEISGTNVFENCFGLQEIHIAYRESYSHGMTNLFGNAEGVSSHIHPKTLETGFIPNGLDLTGLKTFSVATGVEFDDERLYLPSNVVGTLRVYIPSSLTNMTDRLIRGGCSYTVDPNSETYISDGDHTLFTKDKNKLLAYSNRNLYYTIGFDGWFGSGNPPDEIGEKAFQNCDNLGYVVIPEGVLKIGAKAFGGLPNLRSVEFRGPQITTALPAIGSVDTNETSTTTNVVVLMNGGPIQTIGESAFADCPQLRYLSPFPDTLKTLGDKAFANCPHLTSVFFYGTPPSVKDIFKEEGVFAGSGYPEVNGYYLLNYTNKWAKSISGKQIEGLWQDANMYVCGSVARLEEVKDEIAANAEAKVCALTLDLSETGGEESNVVYRVLGDRVGVLPIPEAEGRTFMGWFVDGVERPVFENDIITSDATLKARWADGEWVYRYEDTNVVISCVRDAVSMITIVPRWLGGRTVTKIDDWAFSNNEELNIITIPEGVEIIGQYVFARCANLTTVILPESLNAVGASAFIDCTLMTNLVMGANITAIGVSAFSGCAGLPEFAIPDAVTEIKACTFEGCSSMTNIVMGANITAIGESAFSGCVGLPEFAIPDAVTEIKACTFEGCSSMTNLVMGGNVTSIGAFAFAGCAGLTYFEIPSSVSEIATEAFSECYNITFVVIPQSVCNQPLSRTFPSSNITNVTIQSGVTNICTMMFSSCIALEDVSIPDTVTSIGEYAFLLANNDLLDTTTISGLSLVDGWVVSASQVSGEINLSNIRGICAGAFSSQKQLTSVVLPEGVRHIDTRTFNNCTNITCIILPRGLTSVGDMAFANCSSLNKVFIPDEVKDIICVADSAFYNCPSDLQILYYGAEANKVTLMFDANGGTINDQSRTVIEGFTVGYLPIPQKSGFTFVGWYTDKDAGNRIDADYVAQSDQTLYAHWYQITATIVNGEVTIGRNRSASGDYVIPSEINGYPVTSISSDAFSGCSGLTSITIPNSVRRIGGYAFNNCTGLTNVTIPDSVTNVGFYAFYRCSGIKRIKIPQCVCTTGLQYLFQSSDLPKITTVELSKGVTNIVGATFNGLDNLQTIIVDPDNPSYVVRDGLLVERDIMNLVRCPQGLSDVLLPSSITNIAESAFSGCARLSSLTIPGEVASIGNSAFFGCSKLTCMTIPDSVTRIGDGAFNWCSAITNVTIGDNVISIGDSAFYSCSSLTDVTIPNCVTNIGESAFYSCSSMTNVSIGVSVERIGTYAFSQCSSLSSVHITDLANWCGILFGHSSANPLSYAHNLCLNGESIRELTIPEGVTRIENYAFYNCSGLESVTIPESVTSIGDHSFSGCTDLMSFLVASGNANYSSINGLLLSKNGKIVIHGVNGVVTIPDGVTNILSYAFYNCSGLTSVTIPDSITSIASYAFDGCSDLKNVVIPQYICSSRRMSYVFPSASITNVVITCGASSIGDSAFYNCSGLISVSIPNSVTNIGNSAFSSCSALEGITIPGSVTRIGASAFSGCRNIRSVTMPDSLKSIENSAFSNCSGLTSVIIPDGVTNISDYAFYVCRGLTNAVIPNSVRNIGNYAFSKCNGLTSISIPDSVTSIGNYAFSYCNGLVGVMIGNSVTNIGTYAFSECYGMTRLTIPDSVMSIKGYAFSYLNGLTNVTMVGNCPNIADTAFSQISSHCVVKLPHGNTTYNVANGKWQGMMVEYYESSHMPIIEDDEGAEIIGDADGRFILKPSEGNREVVVTIPDGTAPNKVTVEVSPWVEKVTVPKGANIKIVAHGSDITPYLDMPTSDGMGVIITQLAKVKDEIVKEVLDTEKGAVINLTPETPVLLTSDTRPGLTYTLREGTTLQSMVDGDSKVGDGSPWTPNITVKGGRSGFYTIKVAK